MEARIFSKLHDMDDICKWLKERNMPAPKEEFFPPVGFVVEGVACGFLIKTDCNFGFIDFFVSNPRWSRERRFEAFELITDNLIKEAKASGLKAIRCDSKFQNIRQLASKLNFTYYGETSLFSKEL